MASAFKVVGKLCASPKILARVWVTFALYCKNVRRNQFSTIIDNKYLKVKMAMSRYFKVFRGNHSLITSLQFGNGNAEFLY